MAESMDKNDREILLRLYELTYQDEAEHIRLESRNLTWFTSLILAIVGGVLIVIKEIDDPIIIIFALILGGFLEFIISLMAIGFYRSSYRRHLEAIALRAKLEDLLDLSGDKFKGKNYWKKESLVLKRYTIDRSKYDDSMQFVSERLNMGSAAYVRRIFQAISGVGIILFAWGGFKLFKLVFP